MMNGVLGPVAKALLPGWLPSVRAELFGAVFGHHGRPVRDPLPLDDTLVCATCRAAAEAYAAAVIGLLSPGAVGPASPAFVWWLAGLAVLADWIGSSQRWFAYESPDHTPEHYWNAIALPRARVAVAEAGVLPAAVAPALGLSELVGAAAIPSPMQAHAAALELPEGPVLALIEDQTGSGKTEAALLLAHRLMAAGRADGLFVALPTMATANAMYDRLAGAYRLLFAEGAAPSLVLAHGRRADHAGFAASILDGAALPGRKAEPEDEPGSAQCAAWVSDDRRRAFLAHVGVGTIDQALLAVLPTRHAPLRLLGLQRRVLIVDEAHAYDAYMGEELQRLIAFQAGLGGSTIVLSATLPSATRRGLVAAFAQTEGEAAPVPDRMEYPLVTLVHAGGCAEAPVAARADGARRVMVERLESAEAALEAVHDAVRAGAAVAWIRNAVDDAAEAHAALAAREVPATLFHARFAMGDRLDIERAVLDRFGKRSRDRAGVVVATQVIEQSLDLDFDLIVSDLAPIDLLIQRAGRIWRHHRDGRVVAAPRLLVVSPDPVAEPAADWLGPALRRTGFVYRNHAVLWRSAREAFGAGAIVAPAGVRALVEAVYAPDAPEPAGLERSATDAEGKVRSQISLARQNLLPWARGFSNQSGAWDSDIRTPTRIGDPGITMRLARWADGRLTPWYGGGGDRAWSLSEIAVPARRADGVPAPSGALATAIAKARGGWDTWSRDMPVVALSAGPEGWQGVLSHGERPAAIRYTSRDGLAFL